MMMVINLVTHSLQASGNTERPPVARLAPVTETFFGVKVSDPYRWMEQTKSQAQYATAILTRIPGEI